MENCKKVISKLEKINNDIKYSNLIIKNDLNNLNKTKDNDNYKISLEIRKCIDEILNKELFQIKSQISKEQNLVKILETDFTNLSKFDRISKIAKDKLGLQRTNSYQIKKLSDFNIN